MSFVRLTCLLVALVVAARASAADDRPDVLFIAIDDLNDWIGALGGHPQASTPNIDRLAARGVLFTNAHCAAPACNPSRVALMTGRRPTTTGVYLNSQPWRPVLADAVTLPQHFRAAGYRAIGAGKIYHGAYPDPTSWDEYFPSQQKNRPDDPIPSGRPLSGIPRTAHFDWGPVDATDAEMGDAQVVDWVCKQLSAPREQPLFLACGIYRPHLPWYVPPAYFDSGPSLDDVQLPVVLADDLADVPAGGVRMAKPGGDHRKVLDHGQWRPAVQAYLASMAFADAQVGRVLDALDASGRAEQTIVVLWSDHGWHLGEKEHWRKFALWDEATRVPLAFVAPGVSRVGGRCARPVSLIDVYPTLVDLWRPIGAHGAGRPQPGAVAGRPFRRVRAYRLDDAWSGQPWFAEASDFATSATQTAAKNCTTWRPTRCSGAISRATSRSRPPSPLFASCCRRAKLAMRRPDDETDPSPQPSSENSPHDSNSVATVTCSFARRGRRRGG